MSPRVLICDDQSGFRQVLALVLGLEPELEVVGEAADGLAAVEAARALQPDIVLLDIAMPELDGLEALPRIREVAPEATVVMLTGIATESARARALAGGAALFIEKGTNMQELADRIREAAAAA